MYSKTSSLTQGVLFIVMGALLMMNPFGLVAFINFIIGALIIGTGLIMVLPVTQLPIPFSQKWLLFLPGIGLTLLGLFVVGNPQFLLIVMSLSFLIKAIQGFIGAMGLPAHITYKRSLIFHSLIHRNYSVVSSKR